MTRNRDFLVKRSSLDDEIFILKQQRDTAISELKIFKDAASTYIAELEEKIKQLQKQLKNK